MNRETLLCEDRWRVLHRKIDWQRDEKEQTRGRADWKETSRKEAEKKKSLFSHRMLTGMQTQRHGALPFFVSKDQRESMRTGPPPSLFCFASLLCSHVLREAFVKHVSSSPSVPCASVVAASWFLYVCLCVCTWKQHITLVS
mmetsp:Transcript_35382/g.69828  ORF Transcript_35382/g.69828 Transcript_35382/m.69828 type:complete len:142 (+) Transcript_35382:1049-1474(+)